MNQPLESFTGQPAAPDFFFEPPALAGIVPLMSAMFGGDDLAAVAQNLIRRAEDNPLDADALLDLSAVLILRGDPATGLKIQGQALQLRRFYPLTQASRQPELRLLVLKMPGDFMANTPVEFLLDNPRISVDVLYVAPDLPPPMVAPEHDLVFVAISEGHRNERILNWVGALTAQWGLPVINRAALIPALTRDVFWRQLPDHRGMVAPRCDCLSAQYIRLHADEFRYPLIVRPEGSHAGHNLALVQSEAELQHYLTDEREALFYLSPYIDYRSSDGQFRKYRIVFIEGQAFICHMAISSHWMVHYLNAGMTTPEAQWKRDEEARMMAHFENTFVATHQPAFDALYKCLGLDYFGIDCAELPTGELLIFEVANAMVVHDMDPAETFPYKPPQMQRIFAAFQNMLFGRQKLSITTVSPMPMLPERV
ncbi:MAG: hypothetical protein KDI36_14255 [Pseudomonadales bacterium]|nr:hypothetical protein [Pseudomonadales bacterium]